MDQLDLPKLYCPFPPQINAHISSLEQDSTAWITKFNLLADQSDYQHFHKGLFFRLAASVYPRCQYEELTIASDWTSWLFIWDDQCDFVANLGKRPDLVKDLHKRFLEILNGAQLTNKDIPLSYALSDLRKRILKVSSIEWLFGFIAKVEEYFDAILQELINRINNLVPSLDDYTKLRSFSGAVYSYLELIELCNHLRIPFSLKVHEDIKQLNSMVVNLLCWSNDIMSVAREIKDGDVHNLVLVLHHHQKMPLNQALKRAGEIHDCELRDMLCLESRLPTFGETIDSELHKYISALHDMIAGHISWCTYTTRYQTPGMVANVTE